jgi:cation transport ATPase
VTDSICLPVPANTLQSSSKSIGVTPLEEQQFFRLLASAESASEHPIAKAIVNHATRTWPDMTLMTPTAFEATPGMGVSCTIANEHLLVGTYNWLMQHHVDVPPDVQAEKQELESLGKTVIYVAANQRLIGLVGVADTPKVLLSIAIDPNALW